MFYYLFTVEEEVKKPLPFNMKLFKYEQIESKKYYIIKFDDKNLEILDDNNNILTRGIIVTSTSEELTIGLEIGKLTFAGGYLVIKKNIAELIIYGTELPFVEAFKGTLRKLIKK